MKKIENALMECYTELYKNSCPSVDFQYLIDNAKKDIFGRKIIDFDSYEIEEKKFDEIIDIIIKKYKLKPYESKQFKTTIYLGCSPRIVYETIITKRNNKINKIINPKK